MFVCALVLSFKVMCLMPETCSMYWHD